LRPTVAARVRLLPGVIIEPCSLVVLWGYEMIASNYGRPHSLRVVSTGR